MKRIDERERKNNKRFFLFLVEFYRVVERIVNTAKEGSLFLKFA
jgi:hypothetical protein